MGRRSEHTLEQIKEMAISAAEKLAGKSGLAELSTRKIAAQMGYTSGTLYIVFKNLDELVLQVNARTLDKLEKAVAAADKAAKDSKAGVAAICQAYLDFCQKNRKLWELVFEYPWKPSTRRPDWYEEKAMACFRPMRGRLAELAPKLGEPGISLATQSIWCAIQGIYLLQYTGRLQVISSQTQQLADFTIANFLKGFLARAA